MRQQVFFLIITTVLLASCQHEREWEGAPEIKAKVESEKETRTSLSVDESGAGTIYWNPSDKIDVFFGTKKVHYTSQNTSDAVTATFKTSDSVSGTDVSSTNIWGLYPSNSSSSCNGSSITTTLPSTQYGVPNTFDKDLFPAVAHSSSTDLQFYNVCGGIKFNLAYDDIKKITFRGNNNEDLAGTVSISFVDNLPKATIVNGVKEITLTPKTGTTFTKGADYYFILLPGTLSAGFMITFTATDGTTGTLSYTDNPVTIKRSIFGKKGNMDVYAAFSDDRQPNNVIYYTSSNGKIVTPYATDVFGANIVSNEYVAGRGVITFDGDVMRIGDAAFYRCSSLVSIEIPNTVTSIGYSAFQDTSLKSIEIPNSVTDLGHSALSFCDIASIVIPGSVTSIDHSLLVGCYELKSIVVESSNQVFDSRNDCNAIINSHSNELISGCEESTIPDSVESIGLHAFGCCEGLKSIVIPHSVTRIGSDAFSYCSGLTSIEIPNSVTIIEEGAFFSCSSLTSIVIPNSVASLGGNPFGRCFRLTTMVVESGNPFYDSRNNCNAIIKTNDNELVSGCKDSIIPDSVTRIGAYSFNCCESLTSIVIPNSVTSIGNYAFRHCNLSSVIVMTTVPPSLDSYAFSWTPVFDVFVPAEAVDTYKTADGWSEYADRIQAMPSQNNVIYYTSTDGQVVTPNMSDVFGANIVSNEYVDGRGVITFDGDVSYIEAHAFYNCADLISIEIPGSVTRIGNYAFSTTGLTSLEIPNSVSSIGMSAFASTNLTSVEIPSSITSIGTNPFLNCNTLTTITVDSSNSIYDSRGGCNAIIHSSTSELIAGCSGTVIPNTVTSIGNNAFYGCNGLTYLKIPNSVTSIGNSSFHNCSNLTCVEIPNSVTSIGSYAFYSTGRMSSIIIYAVSPPTVGSSAFAMTNGSPIYVPAQSVNAYKSAWSVYADRIQAIPDIHEAVDLGLSVKWATCNVGASSPEEYGDYFAWGETEAKTDYSWSTYRWCNGSVTTLTKYNTKSNYGTVDNKTVLDLSDDAARANLGGSWRMPTDAEWTELRTQCVWTWTTLGGKNGYNVRGPNGNTIFLPAVGYRYGTSLHVTGSQGHYWSSSLCTDYPSYPSHAFYVFFNSSNVNRNSRYRFNGHSVRPVSGDFISVESISLNKSSLSIMEGETSRLSATVMSANATEKNVSWSSNNTSVATVSPEGVVTAVSAGTATITAWASNGVKSATCALTVLPKAESN